MYGPHEEPAALHLWILFLVCCRVAQECDSHSINANKDEDLKPAAEQGMMDGT